jgi:hypothetical protein
MQMMECLQKEFSSGCFCVLFDLVGGKYQYLHGVKMLFVHSIGIIYLRTKRKAPGYEQIEAGEDLHALDLSVPVLAVPLRDKGLAWQKQPDTSVCGGAYICMCV